MLLAAGQVACLARLRATGELKPDETVVCLVAWAGIKWPGDLAMLGGTQPHAIDPTPAAMDAPLGWLGLAELGHWLS